MLKQMRKTLGILLVVCFLMSVTAAAVSAGPVVVKDKKTAVLIFQHVKTKIFGHHHHHKLHHHHKGHQTLHGVTKLLSSGSMLERCAIAGKSPVHERHAVSARRHEKPADGAAGIIPGNRGKVGGSWFH
jgi:hypothetical protein